MSESGRDFVRGVLEVDPQARLTAVEALRHQWILANHSPKTRQAPSPGGSWGRRSSSRSSHSSRSARSATSLRTDRRRVKPQELERLNQTGSSSVTHPTHRTVYMS